MMEESNKYCIFTNIHTGTGKKNSQINFK